MRVLYFDCFSGISGDMTVGALLDLGIDRELFLKELGKLNLGGYEIVLDDAEKNGIHATQFIVKITEPEKPHLHEVPQNSEQTQKGHAHSHHSHRNLHDIEHIILESGISERAKSLAMRIFRRVAEAEAKVHQKPIEEVHFHEVGALDSILDIVGTAICITMLAPERIIASVVSDGYGFVECQHGKIPVPVPATLEIFANAEVPFQQISVATELVTPTGAAIIAELPQAYGIMPKMRVLQVGYGAGTKETEFPNVLRVILGEIDEVERDRIFVLETNVDDCNGETLSYTLEALLEHGARDVFFTPILMKKNRPGYKLTVLCSSEEKEMLKEIIFKETTTIGIRERSEDRTILSRQKKTIETPYGKLQVKEIKIGNGRRLYPEYESAAALARTNQIPLQEVYALVHKK